MKVAFPTGLGGVIAIIVLVLCIVFVVIGKMALLPAVLIGLLALARLT